MGSKKDAKKLKRQLEEGTAYRNGRPCDEMDDY